MNLTEKENLTGVTGFVRSLPVLQFSVKKYNGFKLKSQFLLCLDNIHDQLHAITANLQVLSAEVRSKLLDNVVASVEGGMVVDLSL